MKLTTTWLVEATQLDALDDEDCTIFRMVLPTREKAAEVCRAGEAAFASMPSVRWSMIRVLFDDVEYAQYDIECLALELSDSSSVS